MSNMRKQHNQFIAVGLVEPRDARQRIDAAIKHIKKRQERNVARFNLWAKETGQ